MKVIGYKVYSKIRNCVVFVTDKKTHLDSYIKARIASYSVLANVSMEEAERVIKNQYVVEEVKGAEE